MLAYLPVVAPVIAILNGVIAVFVTQFKPEEMRAKVILHSAAIALGLLAAAATIWAQIYTLQLQQMEKDQRAAARQTIAEFINSSAQILHNLSDEKSNQQEIRAQADAWFVAAAGYLGTLGPDYVARFTNSTGVLLTAPAIVDTESSQYWMGVSVRVVRLELLPTVSSRLGFPVAR